MEAEREKELKKKLKESNKEKSKEELIQGMTLLVDHELLETCPELVEALRKFGTIAIKMEDLPFSSRLVPVFRS